MLKKNVVNRSRNKEIGNIFQCTDRANVHCDHQRKLTELLANKQLPKELLHILTVSQNTTNQTRRKQAEANGRKQNGSQHNESKRNGSKRKQMDANKTEANITKANGTETNKNAKRNQ